LDGKLDRDLYQCVDVVMMGTVQRETRREGKTWAPRRNSLKMFEPEANVGDRCQRSFYGMFQTPGD
jgi:hypothetical protein